ncbi:hypothetical protein [Streptomyces bugieae]|uniref:Uncharacterized protein n=1 Tax=Streptomyces bugieae TaxID=3098223 RepID=A0ABU7NKT2_9ACTN|nr:hypothetical protein [Streptomyces sp. DSM 41528]
MKQVNAMTDDELRQAGISQEWVSGAAPSEWPYYDEAGAPIPSPTTDHTTEQ